MKKGWDNEEGGEGRGWRWSLLVFGGRFPRERSFVLGVDTILLCLRLIETLFDFERVEV